MAGVREEFPLQCPAYGGDLRLMAFITEPAETAGRSRLPSNRRFASGRRPRWLCPRKAAPPPISPARGPPTDWGELVQVHDDRDVFQASPDELPAIDIHSLWRHSMPRCGRPARRAVSRPVCANEKNSALSADRKLLGTALSGPRPARPGPAVAPHGPRCSANACRGVIGRPILWTPAFSTGGRMTQREFDAVPNGVYFRQEGSNSSEGTCII